MTRSVFFILFLFTSVACIAQPGYEIYLLDLSSKKKGVSVTKPVNITKHKGYDNQPSFHPSQPSLYYSSFNDSGRSDIRCYNYKTQQAIAITETNEREYSPTVTPDRHYLSCIIQRDNNAQDLGKYPIEGGEPSVIVDNLMVGYHVWADNSHVALFVLGTPNTLHYLRLPTKKDTVLASGVGRSLHKIPKHSAISFVHKVSEQEWIIKQLDTHDMKISTIGPTLQGREDLCWLPDGKILMSDGNKLFYMVPGTNSSWKEVAASAPMPELKGITRLAVSADGKKLAVVVTEE